MRKSFSDAVHQRLVQLLSMPERTLRSLAAIAVGASTLFTETVFPESLRETTTFKVTIGMMQQYILEKVAQMEGHHPVGEVDLSADFAQRKLAGTVLEAAGLFTMGFSPLWVFAIAGDAAGGSKVYLKRLIKRLKENGVLAEDDEATELVDVLEALQSAANRSALAIDIPPLSRESLEELAEEMQAGYAKAFASTLDLLPKMDEIWARMQQLNQKENISLERLGGVMALEALTLSKKGVGLVMAAGQTGVELLDEKILDSYRNTLAKTSELGLDGYIREHMRPFLQTAKAHFDSSQKTWTESLFRKNPNSE